MLCCPLSISMHLSVVFVVVFSHNCVSSTEKEAMDELTAEIVSYLVSRPGVLPTMLRRHASLRERAAAWLTGKKPLLIIGGEPAHGKSLLMGELVLRHNELVKLYPTLSAPPALISYDRVHYLFLKRLAEIGMPGAHDFLPEGETHPGARKLITELMRDVLLFALSRFPKGTPIILEAPLIGDRGEDLVDEPAALGFQTQIFIMYSPAMWGRLLRAAEHQARETSAQALAMRQIHEALLRQRGITSSSKEVEDITLLKSWEQWLGQRDGIVLSWDPADDEAGFEHTKETLKAMHIPPNPLRPPVLNEYIISRIEERLATIPSPRVFALEVQAYR